MSFAHRLLSRSKQISGCQSQLYNGSSCQLISQQERVIPTRSFAKEAAPPPRKALKGDGILKDIFLDFKNKFDTAIGVFKKEKITIDPDDTAAVSHFARLMKIVREKTGALTESQRIKEMIEEETQDIPDARTYLLKLKEIRNARGLTDGLGAEAMMFDALEKVEKEIQKPLMRNDKKSMALLMAEFDKVNQKLGIRREDIPKYEEELEMKIAKAQLEEMKKAAVEAMDTQKKKEEFKHDQMADVKSLDIRNFL